MGVVLVVAALRVGMFQLLAVQDRLLERALARAMDATIASRTTPCAHCCAAARLRSRSGASSGIASEAVLLTHFRSDHIGDLE
jgi:hypothetical protein